MAALKRKPVLTPQAAPAPARRGPAAAGGRSARDCALWTPHVAPGGRICFDDDDWAFGDGPRVVADRFVADNAQRISTHFQAGPGLFVQLKR